MNAIHISEHPQAVVIEGPGRVVLAERRLRPGQGDLVIEPLVVGLCATDRELIDGTMVYLRNGQTRLPLTPGHEWVGKVVAAGQAVQGLQVGDVVVGECSIGCGQCSVCLSGSYHRCAQRLETGVMGLDGAMARQFTFPARATHRVPDGVSLEDAAMVEPLAVAVRAVHRLDVTTGQQVLVVGAGILGLLATMVLTRVSGCEVHVAEPNQWRRHRAVELGAHTEIAKNARYARVLEASGAASGVREAISRLEPGGKGVFVGLTGQESVALCTDAIVVNDLELLGSLGSPNVWPETLALLESGSVTPSLLITHRYPLVDFHDAFTKSADRESTVGKVVVIPNEAFHE